MYTLPFFPFHFHSNCETSHIFTLSSYFALQCFYYVWKICFLFHVSYSFTCFPYVVLLSFGFLYFSYSHSLHPPFSSYFLFVLNAIVLMHFSFNSYFLFTFAFVVYFLQRSAVVFGGVCFFSHFTIQIFFSCNVRTPCYAHMLWTKRSFFLLIFCARVDFHCW